MLSTEINQKLNVFARAGMRDQTHFTKRQRSNHKWTSATKEKIQTPVVRSRNHKNKQLTLFDIL
ncbi:hypothetical protein [Poritiphilus flavus]|uniref:Uncharacterized protein n=1 Tax=Poritiphilus flavus TaxID=2697053 RepID=A0A6L9EEQ2_9FLAO|nr:hypothetical protein [Poritiphilus flavus]NAS13133.1 hypothetical protein [Poritiphilus flavus]